MIMNMSIKDFMINSRWIEMQLRSFESEIKNRIDECKEKRRSYQEDFDNLTEKELNGKSKLTTIEAHLIISLNNQISFLESLLQKYFSSEIN